jgi:hypothetical protein
MKRNLYLTATMVFCFLLVSNLGWAIHRFVSTTGSDITGDGTWDHPWQTISYAVSQSLSGDVIHIAAGTYVESNILVDKTLTIMGNPLNREDVVIVPAAEDGNADNTFLNSAQNGFVIQAHNVLIKDLTLNGRGNPLLTPGKNNFRAAIVTKDPTQLNGGTWNGLNIDNLFIRHTYRRGISVYPNNVTGTLIEETRVDSVAYNHGMYLAGQSTVTNCTINHCFQGIVQNPDATTPAGLIKATGNILNHIENFPGCWGHQGGSVYAGQPRGIEFNNTLSPQRKVIYSNNNFNLFGENAVAIYTVRADASSLITNNTVNFTANGTQGFILGWSYEHGFLVKDNVINVAGTSKGMQLFAIGSASDPLVLEGNLITGTACSYVNIGDGSGIVIPDQYLIGPDTGTSTVVIQSGNVIKGFLTGIDVLNIVPSSPPVLTVVVHNNEIYNNALFGLKNTTTNVVNAINNWWGSCTGPYHATNPGGTGNPVSNFVLFTPWLTIPAAAGTISGPAVAYKGQTNVPYSVPPIPLATSYTWILPTGASISSGSGTRSILVDFSPSAVSGNISVYGTNICGNGSPSSKAITVYDPLPVNLDLQNITIGSGDDTCYNATQILRTGGGGTTFLVQNGGSVTLIAGQRVHLNEGTTVQAGGYLLAFITQNGTYCGQQPPYHFILGEEQPEEELFTASESSFFRVYPNPTTGRFIVEVSAESEVINSEIWVYNMMGSLVMKDEMTGTTKKMLSIENKPGGIYIIRVIRGDQSGTAKIIRQ